MILNRIMNLFILFLIICGFGDAIGNILATSNDLPDDLSPAEHEKSRFSRDLKLTVEKRIEELTNNKMEDLKQKLHTKIRELLESSTILDQAKGIFKLEMSRRRYMFTQLLKTMKRRIQEKGESIVDKTEHELINYRSQFLSDINTSKSAVQIELQEKFKNVTKDIYKMLSSTNANIEKKMSDLILHISNQQTDTWKPIAFSTALRKNVYRTGSFVRFDHVMTNTGSGYDAMKGIFTVPSDGYYMFICSFLIANGYVNIRIMKNKNEIVRSYAAQSRREEDSGLITIIVDLKQGDQIGVKLVPRWTTGLLRGDLYSVFSGFMVGKK